MIIDRDEPLLGMAQSMPYLRSGTARAKSFALIP
jgi:hypothetical protein